MLNKSQITSSAWIRGTVIVGGFVFAIVLGQALFYSSAVTAQLQSWKLVPTAQRYTELYFNKNVSLPTDVPTKPINFDFSIHNVEGENMTYPYSVSIGLDKSKLRVVEQGSVNLPIGETATIPEVVSIPVGTATAEVVVTLTDQNQQIDFLLGVMQ